MTQSSHRRHCVGYRLASSALFAPVASKSRQINALRPTVPTELVHERYSHQLVISRKRTDGPNTVPMLIFGLG
jgi:hypothetical protein